MQSMKWVKPQKDLKVGPLRQLSLMKDVLNACFALKWFLILAKECFQTLRFKFWRKGLDLAPTQKSLNEIKLKKDSKISLRKVH